MNTHCMIIVLCLIQISGASESWIVGGKIAKPHSRKYMASLQVEGHHICGGFLIREDFVLTAAHCTATLPVTVVLGAHNLTAKGQEPSQQRIRIKEYFQHPHYRGKYEFDIMLLKLKEKAKLGKYVETIAPPTKDKKVGALKECSVAGWGRTQPTEDSPASDVLRVAEEITQYDFECKNIWKEYFNSRDMICTKFSKKTGSMCQGDSGGPLICKSKRLGVIPLGIAAYTNATDCSNPKTPHVYTKISSFLPWINKVMGGLGNESKHFSFDNQEINVPFN